MTRSSFKLRNVVKNSSQPRRLNLRNVAAIVACLAVTAIFSGCDKDEKGDYTIKYSPGTHSSGKDYSQAKNKGESVTLREATYVRVGYTQTGWSKKENGSTKDYNLKGTYEDDADITLFPFWKEGDDDDDEEYNLPTNVKIIYELSGSAGNGTTTAIKIGENYYWKFVMSNGMTMETYMKHNNGSWTKYEKNNIAPPPYDNWNEGSAITKAMKENAVKHDFLNFMASDAFYVFMKTATKGGKETIAGVSTDIYTYSSFVFYHDPVTKLFFKVITSSDVYVVSSWDKTVTSLGITGLP